MLVGLMIGCQKEGPAEKAGKEVDKAVEKVGQQMERAGDSIKDAVTGDKSSLQTGGSGFAGRDTA
jgi:hypothetical protein